MNLQELELEQIQINIELCQNNIKRTDHRIKQLRFECEKNVSGHLEAREREENKIKDFEQKIKEILGGN